MTPRAVDRAMNDERPEKAIVRSLWLEKVQSYRANYPNDTVPLYLTLSGAEGRDIELLITTGVIRRTEVGGIVEEDQQLVVAIESNTTAVLRLQSKYPGLKILERSFQNLVHNTTLIAWPQGADIRLCQARVVNLDLNTALQFEQVDGELQFAPLQWIRKLCILHAEQRVEWSLLLTLHGEATWDSSETSLVTSFLTENFEREPAFAENAKKMLGDEKFSHIICGTTGAARNLPIPEQQKLLMLYVPKQIARVAHEFGWRVETLRNLRYGGSGSHAPMVTWIIDFRWDRRLSTRPDAIYRESLRLLLNGVGFIAEDGTIS